MTQKSKIKILLVDDHMVVRKGLGQVFSNTSDMQVIGEAESGEEGLHLAKKLSPNVILMDVQMHGLGGVDAARLISKNQPSVNIIALSSFADRDVIKTMMDAGAKAFLLKDVTAFEITDTIRKVCGGETLEPHELLSGEEVQSISGHSKETWEPVLELGPQQRKVLALMSKGFTNPEISKQCGFSLPTARYHVSAILKKLDVSNRSEAVAYAIRENLIRDDDF